jgi:hypothetical protein
MIRLREDTSQPEAKESKTTGSVLRSPRSFSPGKAFAAYLSQSPELVIGKVEDRHETRPHEDLLDG